MVLFALVLPGLGNTRTRSQLFTCMDNLRLIGQAVQVWGANHDNKPPWLIPFNEGGTRGAPGPSSVSSIFKNLSNELVTPKILVCPSDASRSARQARRWDGSADGGYLNTIVNGNKSTSYLIGLHAFISEPNALLSADRNLRVDNEGPVPCSIGINNASLISSQPSSRAVWTNGLHAGQGNVLAADGRVTPVPNNVLKSYLAPSFTEEPWSGVHLLLP